MFSNSLAIMRVKFKLIHSYGALADAVDGGAAVAADPHQAVQRAAFAVQAGAVGLDL